MPGTPPQDHCNNRESNTRKIERGGNSAHTQRKEQWQPLPAKQTSTRERTVAELDIGRRTAGDQVEEARDNPTSNNSNTQKGKSHKKCKGKGKQVDVVETNQPSETASNSVVSFTNTEYTWRTLVHVKRGTGDHVCDNQFRVFHMETSWCRVFAS